MQKNNIVVSEYSFSVTSPKMIDRESILQALSYSSPLAFIDLGDVTYLIHHMSIHKKISSIPDEDKALQLWFKFRKLIKYDPEMGLDVLVCSKKTMLEFVEEVKSLPLKDSLRKPGVARVQIIKV